MRDVNDAISHYNYSLADKNSKPPHVNLNNIRIQAAEAWCLVRNLPLMIGSNIPEDEPHWQLLLFLLDCMDIIFAPVIMPDLILSQLELLIEEHHSHFKTIYPEVNLIPKLHFMLHYPEFITKYGPLSRFWCMRFEAKHRFAKKLASVKRNFKNICKSIAYRTQLRLADCLFSKSIFTKYVELDNGNIEVVGNSQHEIRNLICASLSLNVYDDVYVAQSVWFGCYKIKCGCILYIATEENYPKFGEVISIIKIS